MKTLALLLLTAATAPGAPVIGNLAIYDSENITVSTVFAGQQYTGKVDTGSQTGSVLFKIDGTRMKTANAGPPFSFTWKPSSTGNHTLAATAYGSDNASGKLGNTLSYAFKTLPAPSPSVSPTATPAPTATATPTLTPSPTPSGGGIAERYPGDKNIGNDPEVILADDFESYTATATDALKTQLQVKWTKADWVKYMAVSTNAFAGGKSIQMSLPVTTTEIGQSLIKDIANLSTLYHRVYCKWDAGYNINSSNHNGIAMTGGKNPQTGAPPNGSDFFVLYIQNNDLRGEGPPGWLHGYTYTPLQDQQWGDHWYPNGDGFPGIHPSFKPLPNFLQDRDRWYCYEMMTRLNTPGTNNGELKVWVDGKVVADWTDLIIRKVDTLNIDTSYIGLHAIKSDRLNLKWYDNAVIAKSYIGPMTPVTSPPSPTPTPQPTASISPSPTPSPTATATPITPTPTPTATAQPSPSPTPVPTPTPSPTSSPTPTATATPTATPSPSPSPSPTPTPTPTTTPTPSTPTPTPISTPSPSPSPTPTPTATPAQERTVTVEIMNPTVGDRYEIYYGTEANNYGPSVATLTGAISAGIPNLNVGTTYYFSNRVVRDGQSSGMGEAVAYTVSASLTQILKVP